MEYTVEDFVNSSIGYLISKIEAYSKMIALKYNQNHWDCKRDYEFLNELNQVMDLCVTIQEVYLRNSEYIHPEYALEKLNAAKDLIEDNIAYFEDILEEERS